MNLSLLSLLVGTIAGILGGLFGLGGGMIVIPLSIWLLKMPQFTAQGTSIFAMLFPVGILAVMKYHQNDYVDIKKGFFIAVGMFLGSYFGANIAVGLHEVVMRKLFSLFVIIMGILLFFKK